MSTEENGLPKKPPCPPYRIADGCKPTLHQLRNHQKNIISVTCEKRKAYFTVQTDEGTLTLVYDNKMKEVKELLRSGVFVSFHRKYIMRKCYIAGCKCNDEEGYDVQMHYGPDVKVSKLQKEAFRNCTGLKPDRA